MHEVVAHHNHVTFEIYELLAWPKVSSKISIRYFLGSINGFIGV
jgi:hypothetical protein